MSGSGKEMMELVMMRSQETLQRSQGDTFFGVDKAEADRLQRISEMGMEDKQSVFREECERLQGLHARWSAVRDDEEGKNQDWSAQQSAIDRAEYMAQFKGAGTSDLVVSYDWASASAMSQSMVLSGEGEELQCFTRGERAR